MQKLSELVRYLALWRESAATACGVMPLTFLMDTKRIFAQSTFLCIDTKNKLNFHLERTINEKNTKNIVRD